MTTTPAAMHSLKSDEKLALKILHPPLLTYASRVGCWTDIRDELMAGKLTKWLNTPYFVGEIEGEVVASMSLFAATDDPEVGLVEFVHTAEQHRRKGIASILLAQLIESFKAQGGKALYLCPTNPLAGALYEKHGFWYTVGDGMRYLAPEARDFDQTYLEFCGRATVRTATWSDLPRATVLYNHDQPDWFIKEYLTQCFHDTRFESHFVKLKRRTENQRGVFLSMENPRGRLVGTAAVERRDTFYEQHVGTLSFRIHPAYFDQTTELLQATAGRARELSITVLQVYLAACDTKQKDLLAAAGFDLEARLCGRLCHAGEKMDLLVYTLSLAGETPRFSRDDYYGNRKTWQEERLAGQGKTHC